MTAEIITAATFLGIAVTCAAKENNLTFVLPLQLFWSLLMEWILIVEDQLKLGKQKPCLTLNCFSNVSVGRIRSIVLLFIVNQTGLECNTRADLETEG